MADTQDLKIGLDNIYRFSASPNSRPVGLRGAWKTANEFYLEYVTLGDFSEAAASIEFEADQINLSMTSLNFGGPPQRLHGAIQK